MGQECLVSHQGQATVQPPRRMKNAENPVWVPSPWMEWKVSSTGRLGDVTALPAIHVCAPAMASSPMAWPMAVATVAAGSAQPGGGDQSTEQGVGLPGLERNSGWYWQAVKKGWSLCSISSTRRPSGEVPLMA